MDEHPVFIKLSDLKKKYDAYNIKRIRVFGSVARGDFHKDSDLDLLIDFKETPSLFDLGGVQMEFEDYFGMKVDISMPETLHWALKDRILSEARDV